MTAPTETKPVLVDLPETELDNGTSDPGDLAHYVHQPAEGDQDVTTAYIEGSELVALCGYRWIPSKDPRKLPVCRPCVEELDRRLSAS